MTSKNNLLNNLKKDFDKLQKESIYQIFEDLKKSEDDARYLSLMNDYVMKTICIIGSSYAKKAIYETFEYALNQSFDDYTLADVELGSATFKSIFNRCDLHFINSDKTNHIIIEINQFKKLSLTDNKNNSVIFKIAGEFYSYLEKEKLYKVPIRVEQINFNKFVCPFDEKIPSLSFRLSAKDYDIDLEDIKIHHFYLPKYFDLCYDKGAKEVEKTLAMLNANNYKLMRLLAEGNIERMALYIMIRKMAENPEFMELYDKQAYEENLKEALHDLGKQEGERKKQIEIVKNLLNMNLSIEDIQKATGLPIKEIETIQKNLAN